MDVFCEYLAKEGYKKQGRQPDATWNTKLKEGYNAYINIFETWIEACKRRCNNSDVEGEDKQSLLLQIVLVEKLLKSFRSEVSSTSFTGKVKVELLGNTIVFQKGLTGLSSGETHIHTVLEYVEGEVDNLLFNTTWEDTPIDSDYVMV
jgi:hypothetical protein